MLQPVWDLFQVDSLSPHGICLLWRPGLVWTHVISDAIIALCYFSIPIALTAFVVKRQDVSFRWVFWCFATFILACGMTHVFSIVTIWVPVYGLEAGAKVLTAAASIMTAISLWTLLPSALALPSPKHLREANDQLIARIRERDDALKQLQEANRLLLLAEEMAKAGHWRIELPERKRVWSPGLRRIFGLANDAAVPHIASQDNGYDADDREIVRDRLEAAILSREPFSFDARVRRPDGTLRKITISGVCQFDASGAVQALFGVSLDVTELRQTEENLRLRERQLQAVLDHMPALIGYWDRDLRNRLANLRYLDWYGKQPSDFLGAHIRDVIGEDTFISSVPYIEGVLRGEHQTFERRIPGPDGGVRVTLGSFVPDIRDDGSVEGFFALLIDISDRKKAEDRLRASEAFLDRVGRVAGIGGWEILLPFGELSWSDQTRRIHEVDETFKPDLASAFAFYPSDVRDGVQEAYDKALRTGAPWDLELPLITARGRQIWVRTAGEVERVDGHLTRAFGVFQDITERKLIERDREMGLVLLEEARAAAEHARREAETASEAKSDFLATMSHEIRTPLNSIVGFTGLLVESRELGHEDRRAAELVQSSANALLTIVNDVLDFSKLEADQFELQRQGFFIHEWVRDTVAMMSDIAARKGLYIGLEIAPDIPAYVVGDDNRLRQILLNLLGNALKFTESGSIEVTVDIVLSGTNPLIRFTVKDTGIGVPADRLDFLFRRFSQVDSSIGRRFGGTGLGLAICDKLVRLMNGQIGVDSEDGVGSSFWFSVPLPEADVPVHHQTSASRRQVSKKRGRILVVEDMVVNQELARRVLVAGGHRVDSASSGIEAINKVQEDDYDVILMDIQMPGMDGVATARRIRKLDHSSCAIPIFAMTANVLARQIMAFEDAGMNGHIAKPVKRDELLDLVDEILSSTNCERPRFAMSMKGINPQIAEDMINHVGPDDFGRLVHEFQDCLRHRSTDRDIGKAWQDLMGDVHGIMTAAGSLGFEELFEICQGINALSKDTSRLVDLVQQFDETCADLLQDADVLEPAT